VSNGDAKIDWGHVTLPLCAALLMQQIVSLFVFASFCACSGGTASKLLLPIPLSLLAAQLRLCG
jgi:hypothetical protein